MQPASQLLRVVLLAHMFALVIFSNSKLLNAQGGGGELPAPMQTSYISTASNTILRVWVDDAAIVFVNGKETQPQTWAGEFSGSRLFSLSGLNAGRAKEVVVLARYQGPGEAEHALEERTFVQPGGYHEVRFSNPSSLEQHGILENVMGEPSPNDPNFFAPSQAHVPSGDHVKVFEALKLAQTAAEEAKMYAEVAKNHFQAVALQIEAAKVSAEQAAKQAARTNLEEIVLTQDHKPMIAWVSYSNDGRLLELNLDHLTPKAYVLIGTRGAIQNLDGVEVALNFYMSVENEGQVEREFKLMGHRTTFTKGKSMLTMILDNPAALPPVWPELETEIRKNWSRIYHDKQKIKIAIKAVRPDGTELQVAGIGNRLTLEFRNQ